MFATLPAVRGLEANQPLCIHMTFVAIHACHPRRQDMQHDGSVIPIRDCQRTRSDRLGPYVFMARLYGVGMADRMEPLQAIRVHDLPVILVSSYRGVRDGTFRLFPRTRAPVLGSGVNGVYGDVTQKRPLAACGVMRPALLGVTYSRFLVKFPSLYATRIFSGRSLHTVPANDAGHATVRRDRAGKRPLPYSSVSKAHKPCVGGHLMACLFRFDFLLPRSAIRYFLDL
jgi:hypothetical protein